MPDDDTRAFNLLMKSVEKKRVLLGMGVLEDVCLPLSCNASVLQADQV